MARVVEAGDRSGDRSGNRPEDRAATAAEVWRSLLDYFFSHREHSIGVAHELGLTPGHVKTLFVLDRDVPRSMGELAGTLVCDASNATWLVDRLEERGLVARGQHPHDRRVKTVVLTPEGAELKARLIERMSAPPADLLAMDAADLAGVAEALRLLPPQPPFWESDLAADPAVRREAG